MIGDNGFEASVLADNMRSNLLSIDQLRVFKERVAELKESALATTFVGTTEQISEALGQFHFMKGKIEAYEEILSNHDETTGVIKAEAAKRPAQQQ